MNDLIADDFSASRMVTIGGIISMLMPSPFNIAIVKRWCLSVFFTGLYSPSLIL